jgi:hypothetical protein
LRFSTVSVPAPIGSVAITPSATIAQASMFLGDAMVPLPQEKVKTKILNLEFIEMHAGAITRKLARPIFV